MYEYCFKCYTPLADVPEVLTYDGWDFCGKNCRGDYQVAEADSTLDVKRQPA